MLSDDEAHEQLLQLWMVVTVGPAIAVAVAIYLREHLFGWATAHGVLITSDPVVTIPGAAGGGLDLPRLVFAVAGLALALGALVLGARHHVQRRRRIE